MKGSLAGFPLTTCLAGCKHSLCSNFFAANEENRKEDCGFLNRIIMTLLKSRMAGDGEYNYSLLQDQSLPEEGLL